MICSVVMLIKTLITLHTSARGQAIVFDTISVMLLCLNAHAQTTQPLFISNVAIVDTIDSCEPACMQSLSLREKEQLKAAAWTCVCRVYVL